MLPNSLFVFRFQQQDTSVLRKHKDYYELATWCEAQRWLWSREYPSELEAHDVSEAMDNSTEDVDMADEADEASVDDSTEIRNEDLLELSAVGRPAADAQSEGPFNHMFSAESCSRDGSAWLQAEAPENDHLPESTTSLPEKKSLELSEAEAISTGCATAESAVALTVSRGAPEDRTNDATALLAAEAAAATNAFDVSMDAGCDTKPAPNYLTQARKDKLDALGFVWCKRTRRIMNVWDDMFQKVRWVGVKALRCTVNQSCYSLAYPRMFSWSNTRKRMGIV